MALNSLHSTFRRDPPGISHLCKGKTLRPDAVLCGNQGGDFPKLCHSRILCTGLAVSSVFPGTLPGAIPCVFPFTRGRTLFHDNEKPSWA